MGKTYFISDLHLQAQHPEITHIFFNFLSKLTQEADALYILGDLFEAWIGDDDLSSFNLPILQVLKQATQSGLPIFFIRGNRDFLIGQKFAEMTGVQILKDPSIIYLYGVRTLLMHGDSLCTFDVKHQKMRKIMHNRIFQRLALLIPLSLRRKIGGFWRKKSRSHISEAYSYMMDVNPHTVQEVIQKFQTPLLIHGHTHRPGIHPLPQVERIVLGAWHTHGHALMVDREHHKEFIQFSVKPNCSELLKHTSNGYP